MDLFLKISVLPLKGWFSSFGHTQFPKDPCPPFPPATGWILPYDHTQTGQLCLNTSVRQVIDCRCTLLAGNSPISLAGSEEQINFSQQSAKMLKTVSESCIHALLLFLGLFLKISRWVPLHELQRTANVGSIEDLISKNIQSSVLNSAKLVVLKLTFQDISTVTINFAEFNMSTVYYTFCWSGLLQILRSYPPTNLLFENWKTFVILILGGGGGSPS